MHDTVVGGGGAAEDRHLGAGEAVDHAADAAVVGPEVVAPVGDAVHLVDDDQPRPAADERHDLVRELGVGEPLGRDDQQVDRVVAQRVGQLVDRGVVGRVDRHAAQAEPAGGLDLVAHEREQRRDQQRRPEPLLAQQVGGEEVDRRLAPPGALHHEHPRPVVHERLDRLALIVPELGVGPRGEPPECVEQRIRVGHGTEHGSWV